MKIKVKQNFSDDNKPADPTPAPAPASAEPAPAPAEPAPDKLDVVNEKIDKLTELFTAHKEYCDKKFAELAPAPAPAPAPAEPAPEVDPNKPEPEDPKPVDVKNFDGPLNVDVNADGVKEDVEKISDEVDAVVDGAEEDATKEVYAQFGKVSSSVKKLVKEPSYKNFSAVLDACKGLSETSEKQFSSKAGKLLEAVKNFTDTIDDVLASPELAPAADPKPAPAEAAATDPAKVENKTPVTFSKDVCPVCGEKECKCPPKNYASKYDLPGKGGPTHEQMQGHGKSGKGFSDPTPTNIAPTPAPNAEPKIDPVEFADLEEANADLEDKLDDKDPVISKFGKGVLEVTNKAFSRQDADAKIALIKTFSEVALNAEVVSEVSQEEDPELADKNDRIINAENTLGDTAIVEFSKNLREFSKNPTKENRNKVMATFAEVMEEAVEMKKTEETPPASDPAPAEPKPEETPAPDPKPAEDPKTEEKPAEPATDPAPTTEPPKAPEAPAPKPEEAPKAPKEEKDDDDDVVIPKSEVANFSDKGNNKYDTWLKEAYLRWF